MNRNQTIKSVGIVLAVLVLAVIAASIEYFNSDKPLAEKTPVVQTPKEKVIWENPNKKEGDVLILAKLDDENKAIDVMEYSPYSEKLLRTASIPVVDSLASSSYGSSGSNDAVQFNVKNGDIFFATTGLQGMGGCGNFDGSCTFRIRQTNFGASRSKLIYESENYGNWIIDPNHNGIYVLESMKDGVVIKHIDYVNSKITEIGQFVGNEYFSHTELSIGPDGKNLYFVSTSRNSSDPIITTYDIENNRATNAHVKNSSDFYETDISPDGKLFSFYESRNTLAIYDFSTKSIHKVALPGLVTNYNLNWSFNTVYFDVDNTLYAYDVVNQEYKKILEKIKFPFPVSKSGNYFLKKSDVNGEMKIYDLQNNAEMKPELAAFMPDHVSEINGLKWYSKAD